MSSQMALTLRHPFHEHALSHDYALTWRDLRERCSFECGICSLEVRGAAYQCDGCCYILHESCALVEIPLQIEHPIHPEFPLVFNSGKYRCDLCGISHDASFVIATLMPLEEEGAVECVYHPHPLTAFHLKLPNWISCTACTEPIPGPAYGCQSCKFFVHESCARLPREMLRHPFHPQHPLTLSFSEFKVRCHVCDHSESECMAYYCEECKLWIDVECATLLLSLQDQEKEDPVGIDHLSHGHPVLSGQVEESKRTKLCCAACDLKISGEVYYCLGCSFFLHKLCADDLPRDMAHYLHPEHPLGLLTEPPSKDGFFKCGCCGVRYSGTSYHCASCEFDLSLKCAVQTFSAVRDGIATEIQYFGHDHPLVLRSSRPNEYFSCKACKLQNSGLAYSCGDCRYNLHRSCAELPLRLEHPYHSHPLNLVPEDNTCDNCDSKFEGFTFNCPECAFNLCLKCAIERPTLKHQLHEHALGFLETIPDEDSVMCNSCGKVDNFDLYCCRRCNFNLHRSCVSLPKTIQHEFHPYHPLVLFDRFVDGLPEYQYCDYCEEIRNPDHGVYRCARAECWYTVHIGCVLPQVMQHGNPRLDNLTNEIASLEGAIEVKKKDLVALERKLGELKGERREILSKA